LKRNTSLKYIKGQIVRHATIRCGFLFIPHRVELHWLLIKIQKNNNIGGVSPVPVL